MGKFTGILGVVEDYEEQLTDGIPNGVYSPVIKTFKVTGELLKDYSHRNSATQKMNDDISISNRFSFIAPTRIVTLLVAATANKNITAIYMEWMGIKLKVTDIEISMPRIILSTNGIWSEEHE